jgi:hypothetical protein
MVREHPSGELPKPEPKYVDGEIIRCEGERQVKRTTPLTGSRVSQAHRTRYEKKLFTEVATYRENDQKRREEAPQLKKAADLYWKYCVAYEFPKKLCVKRMKESLNISLTLFRIMI